MEKTRVVGSSWVGVVALGFLTSLVSEPARAEGSYSSWRDCSPSEISFGFQGSVRRRGGASAQPFQLVYGGGSLFVGANTTGNAELELSSPGFESRLRDLPSDSAGDAWLLALDREGLIRIEPETMDGAEESLPGRQFINAIRYYAEENVALASVLSERGVASVAGCSLEDPALGVSRGPTTYTLVLNAARCLGVVSEDDVVGGATCRMAAAAFRRPNSPAPGAYVNKDTVGDGFYYAFGWEGAAADESLFLEKFALGPTVQNCVVLTTPAVRSVWQRGNRRSELSIDIARHPTEKKLFIGGAFAQTFNLGSNNAVISRIMATQAGTVFDYCGTGYTYFRTALNPDTLAVIGPTVRSCNSANANIPGSVLIPTPPVATLPVATPVASFLAGEASVSSEARTTIELSSTNYWQEPAPPRPSPRRAPLPDPIQLDLPSPTGTWFAGGIATDYVLALDSEALRLPATGNGLNAYFVHVNLEANRIEGRALFGGNGRQAITAAAVDAAGNLIAAGEFTGSFTVGGKTLSARGGKDLFVLQVSPEGDVLLARSFGGPGEDSVATLAVDPETSSFVLSGDTAGGLDFGGGNLPRGAYFASFNLNPNAGDSTCATPKACWSGQCDPWDGCVSEPVSDGTACTRDDGNAGTCRSGRCRAPRR
jgi:hypothetical protein